MHSNASDACVLGDYDYDCDCDCVCEKSLTTAAEECSEYLKQSKNLDKRSLCE